MRDTYISTFYAEKCGRKCGPKCGRKCGPKCGRKSDDTVIEDCGQNVKNPKNPLEDNEEKIPYYAQKTMENSY